MVVGWKKWLGSGCSLEAMVLDLEQWLWLRSCGCGLGLVDEAQGQS